MNQATEFPGREGRDGARQSVCFSAQVSSFLLSCALDGRALLRRFTAEGDALACFCLHRWVLEERAIKHQQVDIHGWVWLSSSDRQSSFQRT